MTFLRHLPALACAAFFLAGCSEMKFVNAPADSAEDHDTREDFHLTGVTADLTTGGLVQTKILGERAVYSEPGKLALIAMEGVTVYTFGDDRTTKGKTLAKTSTVHLADKPELKRKQNDIDFKGDVVHHVPRNDDPTTDSMVLWTDRLIWENSDNQFHAPGAYGWLINAPGKPPLYGEGDEMWASQDLVRWRTVHSAIGTNKTGELRGAATTVRQELDQLESSGQYQYVPVTSEVAAPELEVPEVEEQPEASVAILEVPETPAATPEAAPIEVPDIQLPEPADAAATPEMPAEPAPTPTPALRRAPAKRQITPAPARRAPRATPKKKRTLIPTF